MWFSIISGLGIGLFGSFHCVGMCGPIALSLPVYGKSLIEKLLLIISYNFGRATAYALLGVVFGYIGQQFFLFGYQQVFSVTLGCLILLFFLGKKYFSGNIILFGRFYHKVKLVLTGLLQSANNTLSYFLVGFANGFLPCGLVYVAIGAAMATGSIWSGAALMFVFGLGTFPFMIGIMIFSTHLPAVFRSRMRKLVPLFVCATALVLLLRGMGLGIPYLSPRVAAETAQFHKVQCHP